MDLNFNDENIDHNILCELYFFNFIPIDNSTWNPNSCVRDVNLRALMSYITNLIQWSNCIIFMG